MKKAPKLTLAFLLSLAIPAVVLSQPARILRDSGLRKLSVFIGKWKAESTIDANHKDKISAVYTCRWSDNGRYMIADQLVNNNGKETNNLSIYNYNADKGDYTLSLVGIPGVQPFSIGVQARGDTLFYNSEYTDNGKKMYNRTLNIFASPTSYIYKVQFSDDGVTWRTDGEGSARKMP
ncbi:MAG TPA: hypothetical protein VKQ52_02340 [Puia sp.]|nr:hypothetical protein [Puia sp.]